MNVNKQTGVVPVKKNFFTKRSTIIAAAVAVLLVIAGITPLILQAKAHSDALAAYQTQEELRQSAIADIAEATKDAKVIQTEALEVYTQANATAAAASVDLTFFEPFESVNTLLEEISLLLGASNISLDYDATPTLGELDQEPLSAEGTGLTAENSTDELLAATEVLKETLSVAKGQLEFLTGFKSDVATAMVNVTPLVPDVVAAGAKSGKTFARPEKSSDDSWKAYEAALAAIQEDQIITADQAAEKGTEASDLAALVKNYVDARKAAIQSDIDVRAAEEKAAAEAEVQRQLDEIAARNQQLRNGSSGSGGRSGGGSGGSSGNSGNSGSSSGSSGGQIIIPGGGGGSDYCNELYAQGGSCVG